MQQEHAHDRRGMSPLHRRMITIGKIASKTQQGYIRIEDFE